MKAYKFEVLVLDQEDYDIEEVKRNIEESRYFIINVIESKEKYIPEWDDDHILNKCNITKAQVDAFFNNK